MGAVATLPDLDRRLSRKIEQGKAIQLTPEDLDLLVTTGAIDTFRRAVAEYQRNQCRERSARSRSISGGNSNSTRERVGRTSKSSGMIPPQGANEALARAQAMLGKAARPLTRNT